MPKGPANRMTRRSPLNLRTTAELRAKLDEAAEMNGRSVTQEIEWRIELSFEEEKKQPLLDAMRRLVREEIRAAIPDRGTDDAA